MMHQPRRRLVVISAATGAVVIGMASLAAAATSDVSIPRRLQVEISVDPTITNSIATDQGVNVAMVTESSEPETEPTVSLLTVSGPTASLDDDDLVDDESGDDSDDDTAITISGATPVSSVDDDDDDDDDDDQGDHHDSGDDHDDDDHGDDDHGDDDGGDDD